jgi:hypothetical protein
VRENNCYIFLVQLLKIRPVIIINSRHDVGSFHAEQTLKFEEIYTPEKFKFTEHFLYVPCIKVDSILSSDKKDEPEQLLIPLQISIYSQYQYYHKPGLNIIAVSVFFSVFNYVKPQ